MTVPRINTRLIVSVFAVLLATLLSACGGAGGGSQPTATFGPAVQTQLAEAQQPRATSTPTTEPAAQDPTPTAVPAQETATPAASDPGRTEPDPATDALLLALLTLGDMPEGWRGGEVIDEGGNSSNWSGDDEMFASPNVPDECGYGFDDPYLREISAYFEDPEQEFILMHMVSLYANAQSAELLLNQMIGAMTRCPEVHDVYDDGSGITTRFSVLADPLVGDQSGSFSVGSSGDEFNTAIVVTVFRIGPVLSFIVQIGSAQDSGPVETWNLNEFAIRSVDKLIPLRETFDALETAPENVI